MYAYIQDKFSNQTIKSNSNDGINLIAKYVSYMEGGAKCVGDKDCLKKGTICNSITGRCVKASGKAGKAEMKKRRFLEPVVQLEAPVQVEVPVLENPAPTGVKNPSSETKGPRNNETKSSKLSVADVEPTLLNACRGMASKAGGLNKKLFVAALL